MAINVEITKEQETDATAITDPERITAHAIPTTHHYPSTEPAVVHVQPVTCLTGVASMIVGIVGLCLCTGFCMGPMAIGLGVRARRHIRFSQGRLTGGGYATAGIMLGTAGFVLGNVLLLSFAALFGLPWNTPRMAFH